MTLSFEAQGCGTTKYVQTVVSGVNCKTLQSLTTQFGRGVRWKGGKKIANELQDMHSTSSVFQPCKLLILVSIMPKAKWSEHYS